MTKGRNRAVLITGATGSVGESLVAGFAGEGYRVSFLYHQAESLAYAMAEKFGATPIQADLSRPIDLAFAIRDTTFGQVVGRELDPDLVAGHDADKVLAHFSRHVSQNLMAPLDFNAKSGVGQRLRHNAFDLQRFFFFRHRRLPIQAPRACRPPQATSQ